MNEKPITFRTGRAAMNLATSSLFSQLLSLIDRNRFARLVRETGSERRSKGFASWDHRIHQALDYAKPWQLYRPKSGLAEAA
jgi:hypothetical protein